MCFCSQASVLSLGFLFSFAANSLSFDSTHWLSSSLVGCQQNISSMCSKPAMEPFVGLLLGRPRLAILFRPTKPLAHWPSRWQIAKATWSLTWSDPNGVAEDSSVLGQVLRHPGCLKPFLVLSKGTIFSTPVTLAVFLSYHIPQAMWQVFSYI